MLLDIQQTGEDGDFSHSHLPLLLYTLYLYSSLLTPDFCEHS